MTIATPDPTISRAGKLHRPWPSGLAEVVVVRRSGLPMSAVDALAAPETAAAVTQLISAEDEVALAATRLCDELYSLVPHTDDTARRSTIIALRRDVHNGRWTAKTRDRAHSLRDLDCVQRWSTAMADTVDLREQAGRLLATESADTAEAGARWLLDADIVAGLALAGPSFSVRLLASGVETDIGSRTMRSMTSYLTRTAMKTSPFSTLTTVSIEPAPDTADSAQLAATSAGDRRGTCDSRPVAIAMFRAMCEHAIALGDDIALHRPAGCIDDNQRGFVGNRRVVRGVAVRVDEAAPMPTQIPTSGRAHRRLLRSGAATPAIAWDLAATDDFSALTRWARGRRLPARARAALDALACATRSVATTTDPRQRLAAQAAAREAMMDAFASVDASVPAWVHDHPLVHENAADLAPISEAMPSTDGIATTLGRATKRSATYAAMLDAFISHHGSGAEGVDLMTFIHAFCERADIGGLAAKPTPQEHPHDHWLRRSGHRTLAPVSHAVFLQAAPHAEHGRDLVIVNSFHSGGFGHLARWSTIPVLAPALGASLTRWAAALHPNCDVRQVSPYSDWSDLQRPLHRSVDLPRQQLPGDTPDRGAASDLTGLTLAHDRATATLQVRRRDGRPVAFVNTGSVPNHLLSGPAKLFVELSNPWVTHPDAGCSGGVEFHGHRPRITDGSVVWARERWRIDASDLPDRHDGPSVDFLAGAERWRRARQLPTEMFVRHLRTGRILPDKPQFVDAGHPTGLWNALGVRPSDLSGIECTEALPSRRQHRSASSTPVHAVERVVLLRESGVRP
ncbi:MAG: hypothetical protein ACOH2Q_01970 [Rhodococcus sp. (in: high G+C Gram-positive bacteria)]